MDNIWPFVGSFTDFPNDATPATLQPNKLYFILDEVGSRLTVTHHRSLKAVEEGRHRKDSSTNMRDQREGCAEAEFAMFDSCVVWVPLPISPTGAAVDGSRNGYALTVVWPVQDVLEVLYFVGTTVRLLTRKYQGTILTVCGSGMPIGKLKRKAARTALGQFSEFDDGCDCRGRISEHTDALKQLRTQLGTLGYSVPAVNKLLNIESLGSLLPVWEFSSAKNRLVSAFQFCCIHGFFCAQVTVQQTISNCCWQAAQ
jgi:hypothetical protein